jgi:glycosyltransferase involved in cell wall biosynthesis
MKICCVIPAYNETKYLPQVITELKDLVDEVIVVDDCSGDNTFELAIRSGALTARHRLNRGQGAALRTGTNLALDRGADIIVHFDADGQFRTQDIKQVIQPLLNKQADMVLGSRFLDTSTKMPYFKRVVIMRLARLFNLLLGVRLTDPQSGFRALSRSSAQKLHWSQDRMAHCSEILNLAHDLNFKIVEVPITVIYREFGQKISGGFKIIFDLVIAKLAN